MSPRFLRRQRTKEKHTGYVLRVLGIEFLSFSESLDTATTPAGRMVFTVYGAVAELERSPIVGRVKADLRNARATLGRPRLVVDASLNSLALQTGAFLERNY